MLLVSFPYAPNPVVGAKRFTFLADEFLKAGVDVTVLTLAGELIRDPDRTLPVPGEIHGVRPLPPSRIGRGGSLAELYEKIWCRLCRVDQYSGWVGPALRRASRLSARRTFTHVIITAPPFSPFLAAGALKRRLGAKLVLDYRDPWTSHPLQGRVGRLSGDRMRTLEGGILAEADLIVTATDWIGRGLLSSFPSLDPERVRTVTNGLHLSRVRRPSEPPPRNRRVMLFAGNLYGDRRAEHAARQLRRLEHEGAIAPGSVCIRVMGACPSTHASAFEREGLTDLIEVTGVMDYESALGEMARADILYLPSGKDFDYALPYKFFDYLTAGRPILAVGPESSALREAMRDLDCGLYCPSDDGRCIREGIMSLLSGRTRFSFEGLERFDWGAKASGYLDLLESAVSGGRPD